MNRKQKHVFKECYYTTGLQDVSQSCFHFREVVHGHSVRHMTQKKTLKQKTEL